MHRLAFVSLRPHNPCSRVFRSVDSRIISTLLYSRLTIARVSAVESAIQDSKLAVVCIAPFEYASGQPLLVSSSVLQVQHRTFFELFLRLVCIIAWSIEDVSCVLDPVERRLSIPRVSLDRGWTIVVHKVVSCMSV